MKSSSAPLQTTLVYLRKDGKILLGKKARGHDVDKWNGAGGKCANNELPEDCARRETREEFGTTPMKLQSVAVLKFSQELSKDEYSNLTTYVYLCDEWEGELQPNDEFSKLEWFTPDDMPYDDMWDDDRHWLPQVLTGETLTGSFVFDADDHLVSHEVTIDALTQPTLDIKERVNEILND